MSTTRPIAGKSKPGNIRRSRTGCRACRRRGKKCDESKPICKTCQRLGLECSYTTEFLLYASPGENASSSLDASRTHSRKAAASADTTLLPNPRLAPASCNESNRKIWVNPTLERMVPPSPAENDMLYFKHFDRHVRQSLPTTVQTFSSHTIDSPLLRYTFLCLAASNLSNLDTSLHCRSLVNNARGSVTSPNINLLHHTCAARYHAIAQKHCLVAERNGSGDDLAVILVTKVLIAYYHHSSTDHLQFRHAVWETVRFVLENQKDIVASPTSNLALQLWHRLCTSHRPSKPPPLLIEGEGIGSFSPNLTFPDTNDHLYLKCILGMSTDDLIYDILIKTIEIRTRIVVFRCTSWVHNISEYSQALGSLAYRVLNKMMNRPQLAHEETEAGSSFVQGDHLIKLLEIQKERLRLWRSRLNPEQLPKEDRATRTHRAQPPSLGDARSGRHGFSTHRDAMNYLYYLLCGLIFESPSTTHPLPSLAAPSMAEGPATTSIGRMLQGVFEVIDGLDPRQSNLVDVYTFSLTEVLVQLTSTFQSESVFNRVLDIIWPRIEAHGRGFEHSHIPTHLAKRIISLMADEWLKGRRILLSIPAIPEDIPKTVLFDPSHSIEMVLYGCCNGGGGSFFIEKMPLA